MIKNFRIIIILCLITSLTRFVLDSYLPSLPAIGNDFGMVLAQLSLTFYLIGFSLSQLVYGPLSDHYGRRLIMIIGLSIFTLGNLACALAVSPEMLLYGRLIAGIGAGACGVLNRAIASDCFKGAEFSKAWSYTTTTLVISLSLAPILGGYVQQLWGWHANFFLATLIVLIVFCVILKYLPETHHNRTRLSVKPLRLSKILHDYYSILRVPSFLTGALCYTLSFAGLIAYFQVSPILLIDHLGLSPSEYGWCSLIIAFTYLMGGVLVNKFSVRMGMQYFLLIGTFLLTIGGLCLWLTHLCHLDGVTALMLPAAIYVIGARIVIPNAIAASMEKVRHLNGSCSALMGCIQMLGSALISILLTQFNNLSSLPLAVFLSLLGGITFMIALFAAKSARKIMRTDLALSAQSEEEPAKS